MGDSRRASWSGRAFCRSLDPPAIEAYTQSQGLARFEIFLRIVSRQAQFQGTTAPQLGRNFSNPLSFVPGEDLGTAVYASPAPPIYAAWLSQIESHAPIDPL
jgi:hypothetical protein